MRSLKNIDWIKEKGTAYASSHKEVTNFGRSIVLLPILCYNGTNEKPRLLGEVVASPTERVKMEHSPIKKNNELLNIAKILRRNMIRQEKHL